MGAPKQNQNAVGNRGGRRATEKEEKEHALQWWAVHDVEELEARIASKKYSPWDVYRLRALKADQSILKNWADKVLADLHEVTGKDGSNLKMEINYIIPPTVAPVNRPISNGDESEAVS